LDKKTTSYTIDTVKHFKSILNNDDSLFFIAGGDIAKRLPEWKDIKELCKLCTFVIAKRPGYEKNTQLENVQYIDIKAIDISSSMIRDLIKYGEPYQHTVPRDIFDYIKERKLYI
jgi:nicotinate-nucleotide adenylyltransferase